MVIDLQRSFGYPSRKELINSLRNGTVINCPITVEDLLRAEAVCGKPIAALKGKTTAPNNADNRVISVERSTEKRPCIYYDIMYGNQMAFLTAVVKPLNM